MRCARRKAGLRYCGTARLRQSCFRLMHPPVHSAPTSDRCGAVTTALGCSPNTISAVPTPQPRFHRLQVLVAFLLQP